MQHADDPEGSAKSLAPSRGCELDTGKSNSAPEEEWIETQSSNEHDCQPDSENYNQYSVNCADGWENYCQPEVPILPDLLKPGGKAYLALHLNFNVTGMGCILYGDMFAPVGDMGTGTGTHDVIGRPVW